MPGEMGCTGGPGRSPGVWDVPRGLGWPLDWAGSRVVGVPERGWHWNWVSPRVGADPGLAGPGARRAMDLGWLRDSAGPEADLTQGLAYMLATSDHDQWSAQHSPWSHHPMSSSWHAQLMANLAKGHPSQYPAHDHSRAWPANRQPSGCPAHG